ncbi:hypothetical protein B0I35DRAFT_178124 [Stachybotrys elegans]|uniref:Secreted protein n=1 Tax=Stachybotrys elegans TaxID=80388 RepID=A0A8K0SHC4_9HYPO|nr:hypothetical protein B0I35DRAFT_178124 [Stachybotrys elegans]
MLLPCTLIHCMLVRFLVSLGIRSHGCVVNGPSAPMGNSSDKGMITRVLVLVQADLEPRPFRSHSSEIYPALEFPALRMTCPSITTCFTLALPKHLPCLLKLGGGTGSVKQCISLLAKQ